VVVNLRHYLESVNLGEWEKSTVFTKPSSNSSSIV